METLERLASDWLSNLGKENGFPYSEDSLIAFDEINEIVESDSEKAWKFIIVSMNMYSNDENCIGQIAAGPLEDALSCHGSYLIDRIEKEAKTNNLLVKMLGGIYQLQTSQDIWERVQEIIKTSK
jgi:hypothetical protein